MVKGQQNFIFNVFGTWVAKVEKAQVFAKKMNPIYSAETVNLETV